MLPLMQRTLFLALALPLAACGTAADTANPDPTCQPIAAGDCLLPWPSSHYLAVDSSTATGFRVALPVGVLPKNQVGGDFDTGLLNQADGFSPATQIVVNLKARVDESQLPPAAMPDMALAPMATVQLLRFDTGERVPLFAEVDHNVTDDVSDQVLLAHPLERLQPKTRYVVALRRLNDTSGQPIHVAPFDALVSGDFPPSSRLAAEQPRYQEIFGVLRTAGLDPSQLTLAWDFRTGSDERLTGRLRAMRDQALAAWASQGLGYTIATMSMPTDPHLYLELLGTFDVPSFLASDAMSATLQFDPTGAPMLRGPQKFPLVVHVPKCALTATAPLPIMVYGHGLFGSAQGEMNTDIQKQTIDQLCMVQVGTDWLGLSNADIPQVVSTVIPDFQHFNLVTERLQQAQVNVHVLARLALRKLKDDPNLVVNGKPIVDGSQIYYYGISDGGIQGGTFMALSPDVVRGALQVGGGEWSLMMTRSADFKMLKGVLDITYPEQRDQEVLFAISQGYWDFSDPINFAPFSIRAPLPDESGAPLPPRRILMQESHNDAQVPNVATRLVARTLGLPLLTPSIESVWGIDMKAGPLDAAYSQWDAQPMPPPDPYNVPPDEGKGWMGYSAHEAIRRMPQLIDQLSKFFAPDGEVVDTCGMPCVY
jgi:hypothetical protein